MRTIIVALAVLFLGLCFNQPYPASASKSEIAVDPNISELMQSVRDLGGTLSSLRAEIEGSRDGQISAEQVERIAERLISTRIKELEAKAEEVPEPKAEVEAVKVQSAAYAPVVASSGYGSVGAVTASYGSTGSSVATYSVPAVGTAVSRQVTRSAGIVRPAVTRTAYRARWTHPGTIESHMANDHGISVAGKTREQLLAEHDAIHDVIGPVSRTATSPVIRTSPVVQTVSYQIGQWTREPCDLFSFSQVGRRTAVSASGLPQQLGAESARRLRAA